MTDPTDEQLDQFRDLLARARAAGPNSPLWEEVEAAARRTGVGATGFDPDADDELGPPGPPAGAGTGDLPEGATREEVVVAMARLLQAGDREGAARLKALLDGGLDGGSGDDGGGE